MIMDDQELAVTQQRIRLLQDLLLKLRRSETAENYAAMSSAYLLDIDRMNEGRPLLSGKPSCRASRSDALEAITEVSGHDI